MLGGKLSLSQRFVWKGLVMDDPLDLVVLTEENIFSSIPRFPTHILMNVFSLLSFNLFFMEKFKCVY